MYSEILPLSIFAFYCFDVILKVIFTLVTVLFITYRHPPEFGPLFSIIFIYAASHLQRSSYGNIGIRGIF